MKKLFFSKKEIVNYAKIYLEDFVDMELYDIKCDSEDGLGIYRFYFRTNYNGKQNGVMEQISISNYIYFIKSVLAKTCDIPFNSMVVTLNSNGCYITYNNRKSFTRVRTI